MPPPLLSRRDPAISGRGMIFLGLGPLEWLLVVLIAAVVYGIAQLPERRARQGAKKKRRR